jgi:hypothetical protein
MNIKASSAEYRKPSISKFNESIGEALAGFVLTSTNIQTPKPMKTTKNTLLGSLVALSVLLTGLGSTTALAQSTGAVLSSLVLSPSTIKAGTSATGTVTLRAAVTTKQTVYLSSSSTSVAQVPSSVTIPAGSTSATFTVANGLSGDRSPTTGSAVIYAALKSTKIPLSAQLTVIP